MPDARLVHPDGVHHQRLQDLLHQPRHHLIMYLPDGSHHGSLVAVYALADRIRSEFGGYVSMSVVTNSPVDPKLSDLREFAVPTLVDGEGDFRRRYGHQAGLWLMRPDGHLAYRGNPVEADHLLAWLERFFLRQ
jgi:hypothetical protein